MMCIKCGEVGTVLMCLNSEKIEDQTCCCDSCGEQFWRCEIEDWLTKTTKAAKAWELFLKWEIPVELVNAIYDLENEEDEAA